MTDFREITLPTPGEYDDWRSWASSLIKALEESAQEKIHNFPLWVKDSGKPRSGLPIGADGDLIRVLDEGVIKFCWWSKEDGEWKDLV